MYIRKFIPCKEGSEWFATQKSPKKAWDSCERGDWMQWIIGFCPSFPYFGINTDINKVRRDARQKGSIQLSRELARIDNNPNLYKNRQISQDNAYARFNLANIKAEAKVAKFIRTKVDYRKLKRRLDRY